MKYFTITIITLLVIISLVTCHQKNTLPTKRSEMASTILNDKIYIAGGINLFGSSNRFEVYDVSKKTWERLPKLPKKLNHIGLSSYQDKIYMSGGFFNMRQTKFSKVLYVYDIHKNQ